ncbi:7TM-DISM domain-containing protein [Rasiella sp. SM2506]|uniref:7TM-DISM domain-containing protein n=1 Tax=Rasiella sp. SM2506 TaxID=3423914 RepID=UPI003D78B4D0
MRLRFYPALWCLLAIIFLSPTSSEAASKAIASKANVFDYKDVTSNLKETILTSKSIVTTPMSLPVLATSTSVKTSTLERNKLASNAFAEENSYRLGAFSDANSTNISIKNAELDYTASADTKTSFLQGLYYGFALMVFLINLFCYFIFEEKLFLFYSVTLVGITTVFFFNDGLHTLFGISELTNPFLVQSVLLWFATASTAFFASSYLSLKEFFPKLKLVTYPLIAIGGLLTIMALLSVEFIMAHAANFVSISILAFYFGASVFLFRKKNYAKFYAIAGFIPLLFAVDFFILKNLEVNFLSTETIHIKVAGLVEMLILTYAIVYRMRAIKEEHEMRQTEMRIFLKRQETMNRQSAMKLMEDVYLENLIMHYDLDGLEIKLLQYISEGKPNIKIARKLKTTEADVEELTKELYNKLEIGEHVQEDYRLLDSQPDYLYN